MNTATVTATAEKCAYCPAPLGEDAHGRYCSDECRRAAAALIRLHQQYADDKRRILLARRTAAARRFEDVS